jgi:hypothetical protein
MEHLMMIYWSLVIGIINVLYFCQLIHFFIINYAYFTFK